MLPVTGEDGGEISLRLQHPAHLQQAQELAEVLRINLDTGSLFQLTINEVLLSSGVTFENAEIARATETLSNPFHTASTLYLKG
jgi:hypothetical protein